MALDRRAKRLLDMLKAAAPEATPRTDPAGRRQALRDLAEMTDDDTEVMGAIETFATPGPAGPINLRLYSPLSTYETPPPGLVFFHGGGWVAGGLDTHDGLCRRLAVQAGCRLIAVDYRLAPEHPFPAAIEDCLAATAAIAARPEVFGVDPTRLAVGGDSAGGGLAAALCQLAKKLGGPNIALQLLLCPILDIQTESASRRAFGEGYFLSRETMRQDLDDYCPPDVDRSDLRLSPLNAADLSGLPPTVIHTGEYDPFRDEGRAYAARLRAAGVRVRDAEHPGMIHYFYAMPRAIPYALTAAEMIGADVREVLTADAPARGAIAESGPPRAG